MGLEQFRAGVCLEGASSSVSLDCGKAQGARHRGREDAKDNHVGDEVQSKRRKWEELDFVSGLKEWLEDAGGPYAPGAHVEQFAL